MPSQGSPPPVALWTSVPESVPHLTAEPSHERNSVQRSKCVKRRSLLRFPLIRQEIVRVGILVDLVFVNI